MKFLSVAFLLMSVPASANTTLLLPVMGEADPTSKKTIDAALRQRLEPVVTLVAEGETLAFVEGMGQLQSCTFESTACPQCSAREKECLSALGQLSGADTVLIADTKSLNAGTLLTVHRYDVTHKRVLQSADEKVRITVEGATFDEVKTEQTRCARGVVTQMYQPDAYLGEIEVEGPAGALVSVDGQGEAPLPAAKTKKVKPGPHEVTIKLPNGEEKTEPAVVVFGDVTIVNINGDGASDGSGPLPMVPLAMFGVAALDAVAALAATGIGVALVVTANNAVANATPSPETPLQETYDTAQGLFNIGAASLILGGAALVSAGAIAAAGGILYGTGE